MTHNATNQVPAAPAIPEDATRERKATGSFAATAHQALSARERELLGADPTAELAGLQRLQEISTRLIQSGDVDALYRQILDAAIAIMHSDMASLQLYHPSRKELQLLAWKGFHPESAKFWEWVAADSGSTCGIALRTGERVIAPDIETCDLIVGTPDFDAYCRSDIRAVQSTPLRSRSGRALGMISTHWRAPHTPAERDLRLLDVLARQAADLIERTQAEAALRASEKRATRILESITDSLQVVDADWRLTYMNEASRRMLIEQGLEPDKVIGKDFWDEVFPEARGMVLEREYTRAMVERVSVELENFYEPWNRWYSVRVYPIEEGGLSIYFQDITERKRHELKANELADDLRRRLEEHETLLRALPVGVFTAHNPHCTHITMNPAGAAMLRIPAGANASKTGPERERLPFRALKNGIEVAGEDLPMQHSARHGVAVIGEELDLVFKDGVTRSLFEHASPLFDETGRVRGCVGVFVDITERKRAESLLVEQKSLLELIASGHPLDECLIAITAAVRRLQQSARACILLADRARKTFSRACAADIPPSFGLSLEGAPINDLAIGTCGEAVYNGQPITCADIANDSHWSQAWRELCIGHGILACHSEPVIGSEGVAIASLLLCFDSAHEPTEWERRIAAFGARAAGIAIDRDRTARAVRESEERFRTLVSVITDVPWTADADGAFVTPQPAWSAYTGQSWEAQRGFGWIDAFHPEDRPKIHASWRHACETRTLYQSQGRLWHTPTREYRHIAARATPLLTRAGKVREWVGTYTDVHERVMAAHAVSESEERFRTLAENIPQLAWMTNADGWIFWYNRRWFDYTGTTLEEMQGWGWQTVHHPEHVEGVTQKFKRAIETGEPWEDTFPLRRNDGQFRWFLSRAFPIRDAGGSIVHWFGTNTDITDQRAAEETLKEADRRKDEFLAMLAHELRNPLAPIRNGLQIVRLADGDRKTIASASEMMERQVGHMVRLVDDLLDVSRISRGTITLRTEKIDLASAVSHAVDANRALCETKGQTWTVELPALPVHVNADPTRLAQVIGNLLHNACKFTDAGGSVALLIEREGEDVVIRVRDSGIGIAPEHLPRIFEMFAQVDTSLTRSVSGLGIGLTLVKTLVEMHGGTVSVHSAGLGHGSEFAVCLPIVDEPSQATSAERTDSKPPSGAARRILIVDDNRDAATTLAMLLELAGHETYTAYDGAEAVEAAAAFRPDVVLLDIGLPILDGYEAARRIREQPSGAGITLVALTGWGQEDDRKKSREAGFDHHLVKPVSHDAIARLLAESRPTKP